MSEELRTITITSTPEEEQTLQGMMDRYALIRREFMAQAFILFLQCMPEPDTQLLLKSPTGKEEQLSLPEILTAPGEQEFSFTQGASLVQRIEQHAQHLRVGVALYCHTVLTFALKVAALDQETLLISWKRTANGPMEVWFQIKVGLIFS